MAKGVSIYIVKFDKINYLRAARYSNWHDNRNWRRVGWEMNTLYPPIHAKSVDLSFSMGNLLTNEQFENNI